MATNMEKVTAQVALVTGGEAEVETLVTFPGNGSGSVEGLVLARRVGRATHGLEWIVWHWATALTDGSPVQTPTGAMLFAGSYNARREDAVRNLMERPR